jgi:4-amino-4-deoxy-L-arabinose transferase-like glycosyltransferase
MEGHATGAVAQDGGGSLRRDLALVAVLLLAAAGLRAWHLTHTEVAARDSVGYIRYAWQLRRHSWLQTIRDPRQQQHPGYPLAVLAVSYPVCALTSASDAEAMQLSAQLASCLASVLLVVPMYLLGRDLFGRGAGFWAALVFQCLPASGRVFADGLSEGVFLLCAATALLGAVRAFRRHSPAWFALTGLFGGLAYLTRPEGALIVAATGLVLLAVQCVRSRRVPWRRFLAGGTALAVAALAVGGPLVAITGKLTPKPTANRVFGQPPEAPLQTASATGEGPLFAVWLGDPARLAGFKAVGLEFVKGSHYVLWAPALLGLWWFRDRLRLFPGAWVPLLVSLAILGLMWRVASLIGYVSDRHLLLPLLCATLWAAAAVPRCVTAVAAAAGRAFVLAQLRARLPAATSPAWAALLLAGFVVATLPKLLEPLHANRSGFRDAGLWIAGHSRPWDEVLDPYSWSHYYSGKVFLEDESPSPPAGTKKKRFVVIEESGNAHVRLPRVPEAEAERAHGRKVWERASRRRKEVVDIVVYEVQL